MPGGRDQVGPLERLTRILLALDDAEPHGLDSAELVGIARYGSASEAIRQLNRDLNALRAIGWDIRNVGDHGKEGRYRLHARDTRLRVELASEHQVQLVRAALVAGATDFGEKLGDDIIDSQNLTNAPSRVETSAIHAHDPHRSGHDALDKAAYAVENRCLLRFVYKRRRRIVHPYLIHPGASGWYLVGSEDGDTTTKRFVTGRMSRVTVDEPDTATVSDDSPYDELNPLTWKIDEPTDVIVETSVEHEPHVKMMLGAPTSKAVDGEVVRLVIPVTHRAAFRARLYELGERARVLAPSNVRAEIIAELEQFDQVNPNIVTIARSRS
ncbi:WYL domain-containing protein [Actinobacteria bacterium YIM 96077]|uniref:Uncharacterized protein n=1 Tax=Phytoactinopolyspora halophila TaxID=1981511 RepID=A0A329R356_9ACTN|nr:WYL domain-containing protein [Phytoactinopolyspora halophila]AYY11574.1 WYL domain-containing protein [Actinobacteria bacterium YIM 96077]RAW17942.1 hypothetical protein DPM12_03620 [Phytoactinopolyspora halophila]